MATAHAPRTRRAPSDRRVIAVVVAIQFSISLGYYAAMTHVVAHLHHDLGMLAGVVTLVLTVRVAVQNMLFLPAGALTDVLGPARTGALACALRAASFALLGTAGGLGVLLAAVVLMAVGGALFHPAAQSVLAGVAPPLRPRGFSAYVIAGQLGAVTGPPLGLALLSGGFGLLSAATTAAWTVGAVLFLFLRRSAAPPAAPRPSTDLRALTTGMSAAFRDRGFLRFALLAAPTTLLTSQVAALLPLKEADSGTTTVFFCVLALATAAVQPWCNTRRPRPALLRTGLLCAAAGYAALLWPPTSGPVHIAALTAAAVLHGLAAGIIQSALFQAVTRQAPPGRFGTYTGLLSFLSGALSLAGGLTLAPLLDTAPWGLPTALALLASLAALSALTSNHQNPQPQKTPLRVEINTVR